MRRVISRFFFQTFDNVLFDLEFDEIDCKIFESINKNEYVTIKIVTFNIDDKNINIARILVIWIEIINVFKESYNWFVIKVFVIENKKNIVKKNTRRCASFYQNLSKNRYIDLQNWVNVNKKWYVYYITKHFLNINEKLICKKFEKVFWRNIVDNIEFWLVRNNSLTSIYRIWQRLLRIEIEFKRCKIRNERVKKR